MRITFIIPNGAISGGNRVVFEYADALCDMGHAATIVFPSVWRNLDVFKTSGLPGMKNVIRNVKAGLESFVYERDNDWHPRKAELRVVPDLRQNHIPDADAIFATAVETAAWVDSYSQTKGDKWYLVLGHERWLKEEEILASWRLPLKRIVISDHLNTVIKERTGNDSCGPVVSGVNFDEFYPDDGFLLDASMRGKRVGMLYHRYFEKGLSDGLAAFRMAKKRFPELTLVLTGKHCPRQGEVPDEHEAYHDVPRSDMRKVYSSCAIWLMPSWNEGCACIPAEAMACKCAVVSTDVGGLRDYGVPGRTCLISPVRDVEAMALNLMSLLGNEEKRKDMGEKGYEYIRRFTWQNAAEQLMKIIDGNTQYQQYEPVCRSKV